MLRRALTVSLLASLLVMSALVSPSQAAVPSKRQWLADTQKALAGSRIFVGDRVQQGGGRLALNLDIDNTSLATYYAKGTAVPATLRLVRYAKSLGVAVLFNTGRPVSQRAATIRQLKRAGYPVDGLCARYAGEGLVHGKQRCRASYTANGFTIIANIGNRSTDFVGSNYERAYRLPNYGNQLG